MEWELFTKNMRRRTQEFYSRKDLDELAVKIARERSKKEIKPALKVLKEVSSIEFSTKQQKKTFCRPNNQII
jgi:DNA-binding transcriptional regulator GbsR (MarR family)